MEASGAEGGGGVGGGGNVGVWRCGLRGRSALTEIEGEKDNCFGNFARPRCSY